jgi:hypothetical protein
MFTNIFNGTYCLYLQDGSEECWEVNGLYRVRRMSRPGGLANLSHGMRRGDRAVSETKEKREGTREESRVKRQKEEKMALLRARMDCRIMRELFSVLS